MADVLNQPLPAQSFLALVFFGFLPGFVLRLVVLLYPRDEPRRQELIGELYARPRWERPWFVAEQIEMAVCEGLPARVRLVVRSVAGRYRRRKRSLDYRLACNILRWDLRDQNLGGTAAIVFDDTTETIDIDDPTRLDWTIKVRSPKELARWKRDWRRVSAEIASGRTSGRPSGGWPGG